MEQVANKITDFLVKSGTAQEENRDIFIYGLMVIFSYAVNLLLTLLVGFIFSILAEMLVFLFAFTVLRASSGGYHAKTWWGCALISLSVVAIVAVLLYVDIGVVILPLSIILLITSIALTFKLAPVAHRNRPLSSVEVIKFRRRARITVVFFSVASFVLLTFGYLILAFCISLGLIASSISILLLLYKTEVGAKNVNT